MHVVRRASSQNDWLAKLLGIGGLSWSTGRKKLPSSKCVAMMPDFKAAADDGNNDWD